jgi:Transcriptional Coactivator p15 (PC4)
MSEPVIIAQWELNSRESLRVELHEYRGTPLIGIRKWFAAPNDAMAPGKQGINLSLKHLPRLADAVNDALSKARADGLIPADGARDQG